MSTRTCPECGAEFAPAVGQQKYCSSTCRIRHNSLGRSRHRVPPPTADGAAKLPRTCPECGAEFAPGAVHQKYCSPRCRDRRHERERGFRIGLSGAERRARKEARAARAARIAARDAAYARNCPPRTRVEVVGNVRIERRGICAGSVY